MATNATSFNNTPQAGDDIYKWTEEQLQALTNYDSGTKTLTLSVLSNDLGGAAKKLWSISDLEGNPLDDATYEVMKNGEVCAGVSDWEDTDKYNSIRIANGAIEYRFNSDINSLAQGEIFQDVFVYTIRLANGTLSQARVTIEIEGVNDLATINGDTTGGVKEDITVEVSGDLDVIDVDTGQDQVQPIAAGTDGDNGYGTFEVTADGEWTYTLDNTNTTVQGLGEGDTLFDTITVTSEDGTDTQVITITITGTGDAPVIAAGNDTGDVGEDATLVATGDLDSSDVDTDDVPQWSAGAATYGTASIDEDSGEWTYTLDNTNTTVQGLGESDELSDSFLVTVTDEDGLTDTRTVEITITGDGDGDSNDFDLLLSASAAPSAVNIVDAPGGHTLHGSNFADTIHAGNGSDAVYGHDENDEIWGEGAPDINLYGQAGDDTIYGGEGADVIYGGSGNDLIYGMHNPETAPPADGGDVIYGGSGTDTILGQAGSDTIYGGHGSDTLTGGGGSDDFVILTLNDVLDSITDFNATDDDMVFSRAVFNGDADENGVLDDAGAFNSGAGMTSATQADDRFVVNTSTNKLYYDADGAGGVAAIQVANINVLIGSTNIEFIT